MTAPPSSTTAEPPAADLLRRARAGDARAFDRLVDPCRARLQSYLRLRGRSALAGDCDEEDLLQTVLERAWRLLPRFEARGPEALYRWLVSLARGAVLDRAKYLRAKGRDRVRHLDSSAGTALAPRDPATSIPAAAARREEVARIDELLAVLSPAQREVVERHLLEARTLGEIADELGIAKNAVWERLRRGLARMRAVAEGRR